MTAPEWAVSIFCVLSTKIQIDHQNVGNLMFFEFLSLISLHTDAE